MGFTVRSSGNNDGVVAEHILNIRRVNSNQTVNYVPDVIGLELEQEQQSLSIETNLRNWELAINFS